MRSWFGLWRAVLHRSRADLPVVGAAWLLLLCAITLLVAGVIYGETVANGGLRREIETSSLEDRTVVVTMSSALDAVAGYDAGIRAPLADIFGPDGATVDRVTKAGTYADAATSTSDVTDLLQLAVYDGLDRHATLTAGTWPTAGRRPTEVTLPTSAASDLGVAVGSTLHLVNRVGAPQPVDLTVVGTWQPVPDDPFWLGGSLETTGVDVGPQFTTRGPIVATPEDLLALPGLRSVELSWRVIPDVTRIGIDDVDRLAADVATLPDRIKAVVPKDVTATITTGLPTRLAALSRAALVSRSEVLLLTLQFAILAGYAIVLVAGLLVDRRRSELALLRSRGAGRAQVTGMALSEAILLAIPAVAVAPFAAVGVVRLIGILGPLETSGIISAATLDERAFLVALAGGALGVLALTIPALIAGASPAEARAAAARQSGRTLAGRTGLDLALLVVAGIALWQLRLYGAPLTRDARGVLGIDPLLIAAPAIGLIAGAILAVRIIPRSAELAERVLERRRGLVSSLGARQLARRPLRYTRSALLLMLAAALGTFAVAHAATWDRSQADQAAYQAASDIRLIASSYADLPAWAMGPALRRVEGVAAAMPVERQSLDAGRAVNDGELVALDPTAAAAMLRLPPTASGADVSPTLAGLATARPGIHATDLPGDPTRIAVTVDTAFKNPDGTPPPENGGPLGSASLGVVLSDGDGRLHRIDLDEATLDGGRQRLTGDLVVHVGGESVAISGPVQLESIEIGLQPAQGTLLEGTLDLVGVEVGEGDGDAWTPVAFDAGGDGWGWRRARSGRLERPALGALSGTRRTSGSDRPVGPAGDLRLRRDDLHPDRERGVTRRDPCRRVADLLGAERRGGRRPRRGPGRRPAAGAGGQRRRRHVPAARSREGLRGRRPADPRGRPLPDDRHDRSGPGVVGGPGTGDRCGGGRAGRRHPVRASVRCRQGPLARRDRPGPHRATRSRSH